MSIAWPSLREVRGHLQTLLCLSFCWLPLEGTVWDWAKLDLLSEFLFFCSILAAFFSCQLRRFSFDDYIDNISSSMLERLCSKLWPHLCRRPCVTWVSDNAGGQKLVFRQQILQEDVLWEAWHVEATSWQPKVQISALIQDNVDELDRLARTSLCVSQGLEFGCGKCCWFASPKNDDDEGEDGHLSEVSKFCKFTDLKLVSDSDIFKSWDRLMARHGSIPTQEFKMWEQAAGIAFSPFAVLANQGLRKVLKPTQQNCWDWMHCFLSSGVMSIACYNLLHAIKQWDLLKGYVQQFQLPNHLKTIKLAPLFDDKRVAKHRKHHKMNATASELLTLCTILAHYVLGVCIPANACLEEAQVFLAANEMLDLLQNSWHGIVSPQQLLVAAENCLQRWKGLGWPMIKKHHWMLHFAQMLKNHACIPNCFCMERKNKVPARIASNMQNLKTFEHSLYSEVLTLEMERISDPDVFASCPALLNSTPLSKKLQPLAAEVFGQLQGAQASNHARIKYGSCSRGDVVYFSSQSANRFDAGQVFAFLCNHENHVCILNSFTLKKQCETFAEWEEGECLEAVPLAHLWVAVTFAKGRNKVTTLTPWAFRWKSCSTFTASVHHIISLIWLIVRTLALAWFGLF